MDRFVINLDRSRGRLARFQKRNGVFNRIDAVDGFKSTFADVPETVWGSADLLGGNWGCFISHVRAWKTVAGRQRPAVICEDDAVLCTDFWSRLEAFVPGKDLVLLFWNDRGLKIADGQKLYRWDGKGKPPCTGMVCYYLSPHAAETLLEMLPLKSGVVDYEWQKYWPDNTYALRLCGHDYLADSVRLNKQSSTARHSQFAMLRRSLGR